MAATRCRSDFECAHGICDIDFCLCDRNWNAVGNCTVSTHAWDDVNSTEIAILWLFRVVFVTLAIVAVQRVFVVLRAKHNLKLPFPDTQSLALICLMLG